MIVAAIKVMAKVYGSCLACDGYKIQIGMKGGRGPILPKMIPFLSGCSPWLLVTQHLSQSHNFPQNKSAASHSPRASTILQSFRTSTPEHFGTGIYLVASLLNHSCSPNCTVVFQGRQLSIVATKDVPSGIRSYLSFYVIMSDWPHIHWKRECL